MHRWKVGIVGAGPSGASTALFLLHALPELCGKVAIFERKKFPREKFCAGGIGARADNLLAAIGISINVPSVEINGVSLSLSDTRITCRGNKIGRVVRRIEFDECLVRAAVSRGAVLLEDTAVDSVMPSFKGWWLTANKERHHADVLIGADGVGSMVRRSVGLPFGTLKASVIEVDTEHTDFDHATDELHIEIIDRNLPGYVWDFPTPIDGQLKMSRGVYLIGPMARTIDLENALSVALNNRGLNLADYRQKRMAERGFDLHSPYSTWRLLLVGEAAGIDSLTGEGIAPAIQYGTLAGKYLARKIARDDYAFSDWRNTVVHSRMGIDLAVRRKALLWGLRSRNNAEQVLKLFPGSLGLWIRVFAGRVRLQAAT